VSLFRKELFNFAFCFCFSSARLNRFCNDRLINCGW